MRACVVLFPGLNADAEMARTLSLTGFDVTIVRHTDHALPDRTDLVTIPGGFSYGDYLRCGAIAKVAPILPAIRAHADRGGYVLGVCNGFQILTESGLLPGALTQNAGLRFDCRDIYVQVAHDGPFTPKDGGDKKTVWRLPIAHAEGRYQASADTLRRVHDEGMIALRYATAEGDVSDAANPNGSVENIAGVYGGANGKKNVLGLMPHPERMSEKILGGEDGRALFDLVARAIAGLGR